MSLISNIDVGSLTFVFGEVLNLLRFYHILCFVLC